MKLYEINEQLLQLLEYGWDESCVDMETGEILAEKAAEKIAALNLVFEEKVENIACYIKDLLADAEKIKTEEQVLTIRRKGLEKKADWLKRYIGGAMQAAERTSLETARCKVSFRKSEQLDITDAGKLMAYLQEKRKELLRYKEAEIDKAGIKKAIKAGEEIPFCVIGEQQNLQIK